MFTYEEWLEERGLENDEDTYWEYLGYVRFCEEARDPEEKYSKSILAVNSETGEEYTVNISIPYKTENEWEYICKWVDTNLKNVKEWR